MNNFVELEDAAHFASSLQLSGRLNARFNQTWGGTTCKSTDVPGMSRSSIPHFAAAGKSALHIGYNSASRWRRWLEGGVDWYFCPNRR